MHAYTFGPSYTPLEILQRQGDITMSGNSPPLISGTAALTTNPNDMSRSRTSPMFPSSFPSPTTASPLVSPHPDSHRQEDDSSPPMYSSLDELAPPRAPWLAVDPRTSSSQSLAPSTRAVSPDRSSRRTLLVVYIHGFYGNNQSFRSFPAHVHSYLKAALEDSHAVHTKIYPRYKTYKAIEIARDNFSDWLRPHENQSTDVVLVGHSMGGILSAEVVLMPNRHPYSSHSLKHRILGTVSLDCPFLGLHPGIVVSGISSLFRPSPENQPVSDDEGPDPPSGGLGPVLSAPSSSSTELPQLSQYSSIASASTEAVSQPGGSTTSLAPRPVDPSFNPPFFNDNIMKERPFHRRLGHFVKKHSSEGVIGAVRNHVLSHLEYGGCLADYPALNSRYAKLRALEDVDELALLRRPHTRHPPTNSPPTRVRFSNYYTISTGRMKNPKSSDMAPATELPPGTDALDLPAGNEATTPAICIDVPEEGAPIETSQLSPSKVFLGELALAEGETGVREGSPKRLDEIILPRPPQEEADKTRDSLELRKEAGEDDNQFHQHGLDLPPIPDYPVEPVLPDLDSYHDKDARRQAEREAKRAQKAFDQGLKDRDKALRERKKIIEKRRKQAEKEKAKIERETEKEQVREEKQRMKEEKKRGKQVREQNSKQRDHDNMYQSTEDDSLVPTPGHELEDKLKLQDPAGSHHDKVEKEQETSDIDHDKEQGPDKQRSIEGDATEINAERTTRTPGSSPRAKQPKKRKFCVLPKQVGEGRDGTWVSVHMEGVDEVGAHCGLFMPGPHYESLVGDVGQRITEWVQEAMSNALVREMTEEQT